MNTELRSRLEAKASSVITPDSKLFPQVIDELEEKLSAHLDDFFDGLTDKKILALAQKVSVVPAEKKQKGTKKKSTASSKKSEGAVLDTSQEAVAPSSVVIE